MKKNQYNTNRYMYLNKLILKIQFLIFVTYVTIKNVKTAVLSFTLELQHAEYWTKIHNNSEFPNCYQLFLFNDLTELLLNYGDTRLDHELINKVNGQITNRLLNILKVQIKIPITVLVYVFSLVTW